MPVVVKAKVKEIVGDFNVSGDFYPALDLEVEKMIKRAVKRAQLNDRRTVMEKDL